MNLKVPKKTNSFLIWSFNDILTVLLPLWLLCLISEFRYAPIDSFFAAPFYLSGNNWLGTGSFFFSAVLHKGGKYVAVAVAVSSLILFLLSYLKKFARLKPYRKVCLYVTLPISACALIISGLKSLSASPCPWSLPQYGGSGSAGKCFPAGHASSGFCLFSLYFAFRQLRVTRSWIFLILALALGWILGVGRQAQGAHFLSHSFATMFLDWAICALFYRLFFFPKVPVKIRQKPISALSYCLITAFSLTFIFNLPFFSKACSALKFSFSDLWLLAVCAFILFSAFFTVLRLLNHSFLIKVFSLFFTVCAAGAMYFNYQYGTIINSEMMRNALATDTAEAAELLTAKFFLEFAFLCLPQLYLTFFVPIKHSSFVRGIFQALVGLVIGVCFLMLNFQGVSSLIRSEPVLRNLISPVNVFSGTYKAVFKDGSTEVDAPRIVIDPKPALGASHKNDKGTLFIVVVGETARLANWGLAGYSRDTTPQLRARNVIPFSKTISCGTSTDVSLPCMFSRVGRDRYDRDRILKEESLLPVLQRAGINVFWVDNQSGCKGVCKGVPSLSISKTKAPSLCSGPRCYDEALLAGIDTSEILKPGKTTVVFMHQLGNHGPAYSKRYPKNFEVFKPVCTDEKLNNCSREEIVNAYDNAILYTDHFLASVIDWLKGLDGFDTGLLYVSDHGESLGENNMYLHGAPELIAPKEQKEVPMLLWLSKGFEQKFGLNDVCLREQAKADTSHDQLFSSLLGILDVKSSVYDQNKDFSAVCRKSNS